MAGLIARLGEFSAGPGTNLLKCDGGIARPVSMKNGACGARPNGVKKRAVRSTAHEFREETPRRRAVGPSIDDRYCRCTINVHCGGVNPCHQNVRLYQHFPVDNSVDGKPPDTVRRTSSRKKA